MLAHPRSITMSTEKHGSTSTSPTIAADPKIGNVDDPNKRGPTKPLRKGTGTTFDEIIPHPDEVHHRNLVLCFDGTGDQFDDDVRLSSSVTMQYNDRILT